jgi:hypothetical protein
LEHHHSRYKFFQSTNSAPGTPQERDSQMPSLEDNAAEILMMPFGDLWMSLKKQRDAWNTVTESLSAVSAIDNAFMKDDEHKSLLAMPSVQEKLSDIISPLANNARELLNNSSDILVYPSFVGAWALIEAAFEDMIVTILTSDPKAPMILEENNIRPKQGLESKTQEWALDAIKRIESKVRVPGSVVKSHQAMLALFDIPLAYPDSYSELIEEMNQVRNCILHRNGVIDEKSASICPRLKEFQDRKIDKSDPIFKVYGAMLADYTFAWLTAVTRGPHLRNGLKEEARVPPIYPPDFGRR